MHVFYVNTPRKGRYSAMQSHVEILLMYGFVREIGTDTTNPDVTVHYYEPVEA